MLPVPEYSVQVFYVIFRRPPQEFRRQIQNYLQNESPNTQVKNPPLLKNQSQ